MAERLDRRLHLASYAGLLLLAAILWQLPLSYPLRVLTVLLHEGCHAAAVGAVGGRLRLIAVNGNLSGCVGFDGPEGWLPSTSGYVGVSVVSAFLFVCSASRGNARMATGLLTCVVTIYTGASATSPAVVGAVLLVLAGLAALLVWGRGVLEMVVVKFLAVWLCIDSLWDIVTDVFVASSRLRHPIWDPVLAKPDMGSYWTDATMMAFHCGQSEGFWGSTWLGMAAGVMLSGIALTMRAEGRALATASKPTAIPDSLRTFRKGEGAPYTLR